MSAFSTDSTPSAVTACETGDKAHGLRFRNWGLGCGASGFVFGVEVVGLGVVDLGFWVWGVGFGVWSLEFGFWGLGFAVLGLRFGVWDKGSGLRVESLRLIRGWGFRNCSSSEVACVEVGGFQCTV